MATTKTTKTSSKKAKPTDDPLELTYHLADLPTSQHRAGLVGLVMLVRYLKALGVAEVDAAVTTLTAGAATFRFTAAGMTALFDCAYATTMGEIWVDKPYKNKGKEVPPLRIETIEDVDKKNQPVTRTKYVYPKSIPGGAFLADCDPSGAQGAWMKLWRDMLWEIPRGIPATRRAFEERGEGKKVTDGLQMFRALRTEPQKSVELASTYLLGAQANTADNVVFADQAVRQLLLHFWPFATELFVPRVTTREGGTEYDGYVFAVPDVADLEGYCSDYLYFLRGRSGDLHGYRPKACIVDLPGEAGLRTMAWLSDVLQPQTQRAATASLDDLVLAVDVIHARKDGNNVRILSHTRVEPRQAMSPEYRRLAAGELWSNVFRRRRLRNILAERRWYDDFGADLTTLPEEMTFANSLFQHDVRITFEEIMKPEEDEETLPALLYKVARNYLGGMLQSKHDLSWNEETKKNPHEYTEKKGKLAREALLAMRGRTGDDFVQYVATTIFSVSQGMSQERYVRVSQALVSDPETFRTLLMLAFSAQMPRTQKTEGSAD